MLFRVSADIEHVDGVLAGIISPAGFTCTMPTRDLAVRLARQINRAFQSRRLVRKAGLRSSYRYASPASIHRVMWGKSADITGYLAAADAPSARPFPEA